MIYTCITKCYWHRRLWEIGDTVESSGEGEDAPPRHFLPERQEQDKTTGETDILIPVVLVTEDREEPEPVIEQQATRRGRGRPRKA